MLGNAGYHQCVAERSGATRSSGWSFEPDLNWLEDIILVVLRGCFKFFHGDGKDTIAQPFENLN